MAKKKPASSKKKGSRKDLWAVHGLEKRCQELLEQGLLTQAKSDGDYEAFCAVINEQFAEQLAANDRKLTPNALKARMPKLIWTGAARGELKNAIRDRSNLDEFHAKYFSYIPKPIWDRKAKFYKGLSDANESARFVAGVGRFITDEITLEDEQFEFPLNDAKHPFEIRVGTDWQLPIVSGANIGIVYDANIEDNPLRRALSDAEKRGARTLVATNWLDINVKKTAGVNHIYQAPVSGLRVKLEHLPESYREKAKKILDEHRSDAVIYQNIAARFLGVMDALFKISHRPHGKGPEFTGKVFYVLGYKEEELINEGANAELRYIRILDQNRLVSEMRAVNRRLSTAEAYLEHDLTKKERTHYEGRVRLLSKRQAEISEELAMTILTNVSDDDRNRHRRRYRALLIKKLEQSIPNCKVVTQGSARFVLKRDEKDPGRTLKIHIPSNKDVTDGHLAAYVDQYGFEVFTDTLADITVSCPAFALQHRLVGREDSKDGLPVTKFVHVAPICVDDVFLRLALRDLVKAVHPIHKAVFDPQFKPGVLVVSSVNDNIGAHAFPIPKLDRVKAIADVSRFAYPYPTVKYINMYLNTDNHWGGVAKRFIRDAKQQVSLGVNEANIELMRRAGIVNPADVRVHLIHEMDDPTDGDMWFHPTYRPDPQDLSILQHQKLLRHLIGEVRRAAERKDLEGVVRFTEEISHLENSQLDFKGEHFPYKQMQQVFDRHIDPNIDFYSAVLGRWTKSKLTMVPLSQFERAHADTRDLGVINFPNGNHRKNTLQGADLEAPYFARHLQAKLGQLAPWRGKDEFLEQSVRAPHFGGETFGIGIVQAPGRYPWTLRVLGAPPRLSSWSDLLRAMVKNDLARGDDTYGTLKNKTVTLMGDKHFYSVVETAHNTYVICAAGAHTDTYGSTGGFPPNNTGVMFVCIPADGPDAGPIITRMIPHDYLRDRFADGRPVNWEKLLPEPV